MKKVLLYIIVLLTFSISSAQVAGEDPRLSFSLYQDIKLAMTIDDYGNEPFTPDVRFEFMMEGDYDGTGSLVIGLTFEYADLYEFNFTRYDLQGGYNFRNNKLPFNLGYFDNAIYGGAGVIIRNFPEDNLSYISLEITDDFAIFLTKWLSLNLKTTLMQRGDLAAKYDDPSGSYRPWEWRLNVYGGLKAYINL